MESESGWEFDRLCSWATQLSLGDIPSHTLDCAKAQTLSALGGVYAGLGLSESELSDLRFDPHLPLPTNRQTTFEANLIFLAKCLSAMDYDEVILGGHCSQASVLIPLLHYQKKDICLKRALIAQIAANELSGRISMTCSLGKNRGQTALIVQCCAAIVAEGLCVNASAHEISTALRLALSVNSNFVGSSFLSSDIKKLSAAIPICNGLFFLEESRSGSVSAPPYRLRDTTWMFPNCFVATFGLFSDLGNFWYTDGISIKLHPACAYMCAAIEAAEFLRVTHDLTGENILRIEVKANLLEFLCDIKMRKFFLDNFPPASAIPFSTAFAVSTLFCNGSYTPAAFRSQETWPTTKSFMDRIVIELDMSLAVQSILAHLPLGFSLNRQRFLHAFLFIQASLFKTLGPMRYMSGAHKWMRLAFHYGRGRKHSRIESSHSLSKALGATVTVFARSGEWFSKTVSVPKSFCHPSILPADRLRMAKNKYLQEVERAAFKIDAKPFMDILLAVSNKGHSSLEMAKVSARES